MRLLIVEDESLIAILIEEAVTQRGYELVGPAVRVAPAMELARDAAIDGAVLDVNVHGEPIYPVAVVLAARGIPFIFVTGYNAGEIDERFRDRPLLRKPFTAEDLCQCLDSTLKPRSAAG